MAATDLARAWVQMVRDGDDLAELRALLSPAQGRVTDVAFGYGDELLVDVEGDAGEQWLIGSQASDWRLTEGLGMAEPSIEERSRALALVGSTVEGIRVASSLDLVVELSEGRRLVVEAGNSEPIERDDPPYWEVFAATGLVVSAGPGRRWSAAPADLLERDLPRPHVIARPQSSDRRMLDWVRAALTLQVALAGVALLLALAAAVSDSAEGTGVAAVALVAVVTAVSLVARLRLDERSDHELRLRRRSR